MLPSLRASLLVTAVALAATTWSTPASADTDEKEARKEASEHFRRGVKLYRDADYVAALVEFKRAYELAPNYRVLYNLGQTSRELKDYASALNAYQGYLDEGGKKIARDRKREVEKAVEDLLDRVGKLTITTNVEGAEIQIDDEVIGVSPLAEPVVVNIGKRRVGASLEGHVPSRRVVEVAGRDALDVELNLVTLDDDEDDPLPAPAPQPVTEKESDLPVAGLVGLGITGVCGITAGVLGGLALSAKGERDDALNTFPGVAQDIDDAQSKTSAFAIGTDVMLGVTAAAAVTTVVLFIVDPAADTDEASDPDEEDFDLSVVPGVGPSVGGVWLRGRF